MAKKEKINVERIGKNTGRPITSAPVPVRETMIGSNAPYYIDSNGTIIESVVDNDGVNTQTFYRSNLVPSFKLRIRHDGVNTPDTLGVYNYTDPQSFMAYDKLKPGSKEYTEVVKKSKQYNVPLATYNEASANFEEVKNQAQHLQPGGSIARRLLNKWTGKDKYEDGYGAPRSHTSVRESAHRTALKAADSPLVQAIPVVGDIADGYVAADYAAKGNYKPAMAAIGAGLILPNTMEVAGRMIPSSAYKNVADKADDLIEVLSVEPRKLGHETDDFIEVLDVETPGRTWNRTPDKRFNAVEDNSTTWIPETQYDDDLNVIAGSLDDSMSTEPWWGWDPVEYQKGGNLPSDNQQQQLFVAIITDMAKTLGVEPSQELAEAVMAAFENNDDSQGLITLFTKTKDKFMNETGLFREGGKMYAFVEKFKCGGKAKKTSKKQMGGEVEDAGAAYITTPVNDRKMRRAYRDRTGASRAETRQVQRDLANNIASQGGIAGRSAMNSAAAMMGDPQRFAQPTNVPVLGGVSNPELMVQAPQLGTPASLEHNYDNFDFNTAFGRARGNGEDTFMWRDKEYTTELAQPSGPANPPSTLGGPSTGHGSRVGNWWDERRARRDARRADPNRRSFLQQLWDPHPEPLPTHDRKAAASEMVDDFLTTHSPRAKARQ